VYASRGGNFAKTMLRLAQERERLTVIDDQFGAPTGADLIADVTAHAIRQVMGVIDPTTVADLSGIYHLVAAGQTTWHGYAQHVIKTARHQAPEKILKVQEIAPVASSAFVTPARRPHNSRLDTRKLQTTWGLHLPAWQLGVDRMLAEILSPA
jgi:dTDP-4-dehydrorhamnose reductase